MNAFLPPAIDDPVNRLRARLARAATVAARDARMTLGPRVRRAVDIAFGGAALMVAAPVIAAAATAVKVSSPGPVLFRQKRCGLHGNPFTLYKLRTMYVDAPDRLASLLHLNEMRGGVTFKIRNDPRITPIGAFLRKYSIDELPQLFNVLNGSMTLFGPRPMVEREVAQLDDRARRRLEVKPGLTGLWQVSGRSDLSFDEHVRLDLELVDLTTVTDELRIFAQTIPAVIMGRGAY
jgi:lipopolysaccharide/colanic/teichoic acid biosynthesis glycosyltransferase